MEYPKLKVDNLRFTEEAEYSKMERFNKFRLYYYTLSKMKSIQIWFQFWYRLRSKVWNYTPTNIDVSGHSVQGNFFNLSHKTFIASKTFNFLNIKHSFDEIDWNLSDYGKLWTYHLNFFEYLNQPNFKREEGLQIIKDFVLKNNTHKDGYESHPLAVRIINWVKFLSKNEIKDLEIDNQLYNDNFRLTTQLEYHLLGNHLLEDSFGLLFGAYYFQKENFYIKAKSILQKELKEQILEDGAHYELSPMYHQIILHRVLDCYNLVTHNTWQKNELEPLLKTNAERMLGWLEKISFNNGQIPYLNDAAPGIAPTSSKLFKYAENLGIQTQHSELKESGYRKFIFNDFEIVIDVGQIAPSYQPGHSHADSLQFVLNYKNKPVIVDTGISTYEKNERRQTERSTSSHNTVTVNGENSTKVWSGFRAAERAEVKILKEEENNIKASHNGYRDLGITHTRVFKHDDERFYITDCIKGKNAKDTTRGHLHFHPEVSLNLEGKKLKINNELLIHFSGIKDLKLIDYQFAKGYNKLIPAQKLMYRFEEQTEIKVKVLD